MEPVSIIGLVGSIAGISNIIGKALGRLIKLQSKFSDSSVTISLLIGQFTTVKAALDQIGPLLKSNHAKKPQHEQLVLDLQISLDGCKLLIQVIEERIIHLSRDETGKELNLKGKIEFLWMESELNGFTTLLNNQTTALNLLVSVLHCRTAIERNSLLGQDGSRRVIERVRISQVSLLSFRDSQSFLSNSESSDLSDTDFGFDGEVVTTAVYRAALRSNIKTALINGRQPYSKVDPRFSIYAEPRSEKVSAFEYSATNENSRIVHGEEVVSKAITCTTPPPTIGLAITKKEGDGIEEANMSNSQSSYLSNDTNKRNSVRNIIVSNITSHRSSLQLGHTNPLGTRRISSDLFQYPGSVSNQNLTTRYIEPLHPLTSLRFNIALFGSSDSGKSTIFNSIRALSNGGWNTNERMRWKAKVLRNIIERVAGILDTLVELRITLSFVQTLLRSFITVKNAHNDLESMLTQKGFVRNVFEAVDFLWSQTTIREVFEAEYQFDDGASYIFSSAKRLGDPNYVPSNEEIFITRLHPVGVYTIPLSAASMEFRLTDAGCGKKEPGELKQMFRGIEIIVLVVDISADGSPFWYENLLNFEALTAMTSDELRCAKILLVFTKLEILEKKIWKIPFQTWHPEFRGNGSDIEAVKEYIAQLFISLDKSQRRSITTLFTSIYSKEELVDVGMIVLRKVREVEESSVGS
ncbi:hypothetical protein HYFRA_00013538 [Hymenoscyphus fraxineus]|uniref:Uncharacterized protein n=1 Tax=Hymenoscyphus fraxineus TaxID=746836 RepID=A0A9N9L732_9HELO|nr:hypothetical protein HYFRA_00013538 [Hymenoscyphus fraxineus]